MSSKNQWNGMFELCFQYVYLGDKPCFCGDVGGNVHVRVQRAEQSAKTKLFACSASVCSHTVKERPQPLTMGGAREGQFSSARAKSVDRSVSVLIAPNCSVVWDESGVRLCLLVQPACASLCNQRCNIIIIITHHQHP